LSEKLQSELSNLMLLCDVHHRLIDKVAVKEHTVDRLNRMKADHEQRIELVTSIDHDRRSRVIQYGATVGDNSVHLDTQQCFAAMMPRYYPWSPRPIRLGMTNSTWTDRNPDFWKVEISQLNQSHAKDIEPLRRASDLRHASIFAFAPQPLLVHLGFLLSDISDCDVYQLQREPVGWKWAAKLHEENPFVVERPESPKGKSKALVIGTTDPVNNERIFASLPNAAVWRVSLKRPHNDFLKISSQLSEFRSIIRPLLDEIKNQSDPTAAIHVFLVTSIAIAVELGRCYQPKAMPPLIIYDQLTPRAGFTQALTITRE